jgi:DNA-binding NtrC family response regulator
MAERRTKKSMLVIDDEESICLAFQRFFERRGWRVKIASSAAQGFVEFAASRPDVVFLDIRLPDADGLDVLERLRAIAPQVPVIMITAYGGLRTVIGSLEGDAFDYLPKPIDLDQAEQLVARAIESSGTGAARSRPVVERDGESIELVGTSAAMQNVFKRIAVLSKSDCSVLILGATGTGKEVVARAIHRHSRRVARPFFAVNCAALPENLIESELFGHVRGAFTGADAERVGKFEAADGGTLFLNAVDELSKPAQLRLVRVLDERAVRPLGSTGPRPVDVRFVAASTVDLAAAVNGQRVRRDLYERLSTVHIALPLLRERRDDIPLLAHHFVKRTCARLGSDGVTISPEAMQCLLDRPWPGNVDELRDTMERAVLTADSTQIRPEHLAEPQRTSRRQTLEAHACQESPDPSPAG